MKDTREMRTIMAGYLEKQMELDEDIIVIDADLAKANGTYDLRKKYPDRAIDIGIAEANMASMAAGLAAYGFKPYIFSFCPFVTRRIADQVAVSIAYSDMNVKIVGSDPGITAQINGATHLSVEDVGIMRSIPNIVIYEPADNAQYEKALPQIMNYRGPVYIRQLRKIPVESFFHSPDYKFDLFSADVVKEGSDVTLFATGIELEQAWIAAKEMEKSGVDAEIINIHTIKPIDEETIIKSVKKTGCAVVCENHNIIGGLSSAVAEVVARLNPVPLEFVGIRDRFGEVGKMPYMIKAFQMDAEYIIEMIKKVLDRE